MAATTPNLGLHKWNVGGDFFSSTELAANWDAIDAHNHAGAGGVQIPAGGIANLAVGTAQLQDLAITTGKLDDASVTAAKLGPNSVVAGSLVAGSVTSASMIAGGVTGDKLATVIRDATGVNSTGVARRGSFVLATNQSTSSTTYTTLTTADSVSVVMPSAGMIAIAYQATWQESVANAARAAIFLGANQLKLANYDTSGNSPAPVAATMQGGAGIAAVDTPLNTCGVGLISAPSRGSSNPDVTTGQLIGSTMTFTYTSRLEIDGTTKDLGVFHLQGGACYVFAAAGTYTVSVQYKASSGSVSAKNRRLYVWTLGF